MILLRIRQEGITDKICVPYSNDLGSDRCFN